MGHFRRNRRSQANRIRRTRPRQQHTIRSDFSHPHGTAQPAHRNSSVHITRAALRQIVIFNGRVGNAALGCE